MQNARLDEAQVRIKIAGRNINNLRYTAHITLLAESEEELKSLLMKMSHSCIVPIGATSHGWPVNT